MTGAREIVTFGGIDMLRQATVALTSMNPGALFSQVVDPALSHDDLPGLSDRLNLPQGWTYRARVLEDELRIDTSTEAAQVLQDDLTNSYSLVR